MLSLQRSRIRRSLSTTAVATALVLGCTLPVCAQRSKEKPEKEKAAQKEKPIGTVTHQGVVIATKGDQLVMTFGARAPHTHVVDDDAKISLDGKSAKLQDLKQGDIAEVTCEVAVATVGSRVAFLPSGPVFYVKANRPKQKPTVEEKPQAKIGLAIAPSPGGSPLVLAVEKGSPAAKSGVQAGDYVLSFEGKKVSSPEQLVNAIRQKEPGEVVNFTIWREGDQQDVKTKVVAANGGEKIRERPEPKSGKSQEKKLEKKEPKE